MIVIIGILATIGISYFEPLRENALDNEARVNLRLIIAAQRSRRMEQGNYYASAAPHITNINTNLSLLLPAAANRNWNYQTWATNVAPPGVSTCCAQATRNIAGGRTWRMRNTENDPVSADTCP